MRQVFFFLLLLTVNCCFAQEKILLLNEGNWQADNGRLSYFENGSMISNQWFKDKNKSKLGDTPNDLIQINDNLLAIALNWSNIIQFITPQGKSVAATEDVPNNRQLATDGQYLYVTSYAHECGDSRSGFYREFSHGYVAKIDLNDYKIKDAVEVGYEPEGIACYQGHLFVANSGGYAQQEGHDYETTISIIDIATFKVVKTIDTGIINLYGKISQSGQYLLINSPGDYMSTAACSIILDCKRALDGTTPCFIQLSCPATNNTVSSDGRFLAIGSSFSYKTGGYQYSQSCIDPAKVIECLGQDGIDEDFPGSVASDIAKFASPYDLYVNPYTGYIYATDAASYSDGGKLYQWNPQGVLQGSWKTYINPAHILALPPDGHFANIEDKTGLNQDEETFYNLQGQKIHSKQPDKDFFIRNNKIIIIK